MLTIFVLHHDARSEFEAAGLRDAQPRRDVLVPARVPRSPFFEGGFFRRSCIAPRLRSLTASAWVGFVAYSYPRKLRRGPRDWDGYLDAVLLSRPDAEVVALLPSGHDMYAFAERWHPGFMALWAALLRRMGLPPPGRAPPAFYCNYWLARRELVDAYSVFATRAMVLMETDAELRELAHADANYRFAETRLGPADLERVCGRPYYTFHAFVMERLPCLFFALRGAVVVTGLGRR